MIETAAPRLSASQAGKSGPVPGTAKDAPESADFAALLALGLPQGSGAAPIDMGPASPEAALDLAPMPRHARQAHGKSLPVTLPVALPEVAEQAALPAVSVSALAPDDAADAEKAAHASENGNSAVPIATLATIPAVPLAATGEAPQQPVAPLPNGPVLVRNPAGASQPVLQTTPQSATQTDAVANPVFSSPAPHSESTVVPAPPPPLSAEQDRAQRQAFVWRLAVPALRSRAAGPVLAAPVSHRLQQSAAVPAANAVAVPVEAAGRERPLQSGFTPIQNAPAQTASNAPGLQRGDVPNEGHKPPAAHIAAEPRDAAMRLAPLVLADFSQSVATASPFSAPLQPAAPPVQTGPVQAAPLQTAPHDLSALVDRLVEAREALMPRQIEAAIAHAEFGSVALQFRHDDGALSVSMASADPGFAPAVQAAAIAAPTASQTPGDALPQRQDGGGQFASAQQQSRQDHSGQPGAQDNRAGSARSEIPRDDAARTPQERERRKGIYA